jgi:A/G-specific adenine glycosylase
MANNSLDNRARAKAFRAALLKWFARSRRQDPWRQNPSPYSIWVAEVMLQQTVVKVVIPYFEAWLQRWPSVERLAAATEQSVLRQWEGLGYYSRARNLHRAAQKIVTDYDGRIPDEYDQLISLPGIGDYTAAAILSIAFKKPYPVVEANVRRVVGRFLALPATTSNSDPQVREFLETAISQREPDRFNEAIMELGQRLCRSRTPQCPTCPVRDLCLYWTNESQDPQKPALSKPKIILNSLVLVITWHDKILLEKKSSGRFSGMWHLPTQSLTSKVTSRIINSALSGYKIHNCLNYNRLQIRQHSYTKYTDTLNPVAVSVRLRPTDLPGHCSWVSAEALETHPMPSIHRRILRDYLES